MEYIFYSFVAMFLIMEILCLTQEKRIHQAHKEYKKQEKEYGFGKVPCSVMNKNLVALNIANFVYAIFMFIGLMSSQWLSFSIVILLAFIPKKWLWWRYVDGIITIIILLFAIINKFHFHIDVLQFIIN